MQRWKWGAMSRSNPPSLKKNCANLRKKIGVENFELSIELGSLGLRTIERDRGVTWVVVFWALIPPSLSKKLCQFEEKNRSWNFRVVDRLGSLGLRTIVRGRGVTRVVVLGKSSMVWLSAMVKVISGGEKLWEFYRTVKVGSRAYIAQRRMNSHGWYMALPEYGGQHGFIVFSEGWEGRGWNIFVAELRKMVVLFDSVVDVGSRGMVSWQVYYFASVGGGPSRVYQGKRS